MVVWLFVMLLSGKLLANDATISRSGWPSVKGCGEESETGRGSINQEGKDTLQLVLPVPVSPTTDANKDKYKNTKTTKIQRQRHPATGVTCPSFPNP